MKDRLKQQPYFIFQDSGSTVDGECKPKLSMILADGKTLVNNKQLDPADEAEVTDKMASLQDKTQRIDIAVRVTRMKYVQQGTSLKFYFYCRLDLNKNEIFNNIIVFWCPVIE